MEEEEDQENRNSTKLENYVLEDFTHLKLLASATSQKREREKEEFSLENSFNTHEHTRKTSCSPLPVWSVRMNNSQSKAISSSNFIKILCFTTCWIRSFTDLPSLPPPLPPQIPGVISLFPPEEGGLRLIKLISLWEGGTFWCFHYSITSSPPLHKARNTNDLFYARVNCQTAGIKNHRSGKTLRTYIEGGENISL